MARNNFVKHVLFNALALAAAVGIISFVTFEALRKTRPRTESEVALMTRGETIYMTQRMLDFCRRTDLSALESDDDLVRAISSADLADQWCGLVTTELLNNGGIARKPQVVGVRTPQSTMAFLLCCLKTAAGTPPKGPIDYTTAKVVILDESFMSRDPIKVLGELTGVGNPPDQSP
jgi:hypothetical protein